MSHESCVKELERLEPRGWRHPDNRLAWANDGDFLVDALSEAKWAVHAYEKATAPLPATDLRLNLGSAYERDGQVEKRISLVLESVNAHPWAPEYCILAHAYSVNDMFHEAISACRRALALEPDCEEAYYLLGEALRN